MSDSPQYRFYGELAQWWPLISPPDEYEEESRFIGSLIAKSTIPVKTVLELGSGGGHVASYLKGSYEMTLVDLSPEMLDVSRALNPECEHLEGDMRSLRLDRQFDAVLIYDAIDYMTTEQDLGEALATAFVHCRSGGIAVFVPDHIKENFVAGDDHSGNDAADGRGVRYLEWSADPDPADTEISTEYVFLLRGPEGDSRVVHETHHTGLFARNDWLRLLAEAGFEAEAVLEESTEDRPLRELFLGRRP